MRLNRATSPFNLAFSLDRSLISFSGVDVDLVEPRVEADVVEMADVTEASSCR